MPNVFTKNGKLGDDLQTRMLNGRLSSHKAVEIFADNGIKATHGNLARIVRNLKKRYTQKELVIVDRPMTTIDARTTMRDIENRLIRQPEENVNMKYVIENGLLDLERVKLDFGFGSREYLGSLKLQTDIALNYMKLSPSEEPIDLGSVMKSFDWITEFVEMLHKKYDDLNIRNIYLEFVEQKQREIKIN